jgi:hypothetical protein
MPKQLQCSSVQAAASASLMPVPNLLALEHELLHAIAVVYDHRHCDCLLCASNANLTPRHCGFNGCDE